jgi:hypothetical protein
MAVFQPAEARPMGKAAFDRRSESVAAWDWRTSVKGVVFDW